MDNQDFWPEGLDQLDENPPVALLRKQAALLGEKTGHAVEASIETGTRSGEFVHYFNLIVPALEDYRYELFRVRHGVDFYPLKVFDNAGSQDLATEEEFVNWLKALLSSDRTKKIISSLVAQVRA